MIICAVCRGVYWYSIIDLVFHPQTSDVFVGKNQGSPFNLSRASAGVTTADKRPWRTCKINVRMNQLKTATTVRWRAIKCCCGMLIDTELTLKIELPVDVPFF